MHCWDHGVPVEETLLTLHDLTRCGKVRYAGASNTTGWQMQKLVAVADKLGIPPVATLQVGYDDGNEDDDDDNTHVHARMHSRNAVQRTQARTGNNIGPSRLATRTPPDMCTGYIHSTKETSSM